LHELNEMRAMRLLELLRKGFGYVLLSVGVSRPAEKPKLSANPAAPGPSANPHPEKPGARPGSPS
jgi:hypothetical protein